MLSDEEVVLAVEEYFSTRRPSYVDDDQRPTVHQRFDVDIDGDGRVETCVAAGYPDAWAPGCVLILVRTDRGTATIPIVEEAEGWRDLQVGDLDHDGRLEIWSEWRVGSSGFLSVYVHRWNGVETSIAFTCEAAAMGMVERKNIIGTPVDDIVIWSRTGGHRPSSEPAPFQIIVNRWKNGKWFAAQTFHTHRRYLPHLVTKIEGGLFGLPPLAEDRLVSIETERDRLRCATSPESLDEAASDVLRRAYTLLQEGHYAECLARIDLVLEWSGQLSSPDLGEPTLMGLRAQTLLRLGRLAEARAGYRSALTALDRSDAEGLTAWSTWMRADGSLAALTGEFDSALTIFQEVRDALDSGVPAVLAVGDPNQGADIAQWVRGERARTESNIALTYYWLGDYDKAITGFRSAIVLERAADNLSGEIVNLCLLGIVQRDLRLSADSVASFDAALELMTGESGADPNRESDVLTERARTLLSLGRVAEARRDAEMALILAGPENVVLSGGRPYLVYAQVLSESGDEAIALAFQVVRQAYERSSAWGSADVCWESALVAARTCRADPAGSKARDWLRRGLDAVESLRAQDLPEPLKISLNRGRQSIYSALIASDYAEGDFTSALKHMELAKSRVLVELLARTPLPPPAVPEELLRDERGLLGRVAELQAERFAATAPTGFRSHEADAVLEKTRVELDRLWDRIAAHGPQGAQYVSLRRGDPLTVDQLDPLLRAR